MSDPNNELEIRDTSGLTDAEWAELNKLRRIHETDGAKALRKALDELRRNDPVRYFRISAALFPERIYNAMKDDMAERGITEDDLIEMVRKASPTKQ